MEDFGDEAERFFAGSGRQCGKTVISGTIDDLDAELEREASEFMAQEAENETPEERRRQRDLWAVQWQEYPIESDVQRGDAVFRLPDGTVSAAVPPIAIDADNVTFTNLSFHDVQGVIFVITGSHPYRQRFTFPEEGALECPYTDEELDGSMTLDEAYKAMERIQEAADG